MSNENHPKYGSCPTDALAIVLRHTSDLRGVFIETERRSDGVLWQHHILKLTVIASVMYESDGKLWLHVSLVNHKRMPSYEEIKLVKEKFIGKDKYAVMIFPPEDKFVNLNQHCLHLWHCIDGHPLPEFSAITSFGLRTL